MIEYKLGARYAKSVLELAKEKNEVEPVRADFELIHKVCEQNHDFVNMLESPLISPDKKRKILDAVIGTRMTSKITQEFVKILVRKKREGYLDDIALVFQDMYDRDNNITRGSLTSAQPMAESQVKEITKAVEAAFSTNFKLERKVDPELIGGFVLRVGDTLFDSSVATSLRELKQEFKKNPYVKA